MPGRWPGRKNNPGEAADNLIQRWYNRGMTERMPKVSPELADSARDVLALVRAEMSGDREGADAIVEPLDGEQAKWLLRMTANLAGRLLKARAGDRGEEYLAMFARRYLT